MCVCEGEGERGGWGSCDPTAPRPASQAGETQAHVGSSVPCVGVNTAQERDVSTFQPGGGLRLQGGPLDVGWRCREHLVYATA